METQCNAAYLDFPMLGSRQVLAAFDGGDITSDGGALLLRKTEELTGIIRQFAACFTDHRNPQLIEHTLEHLVAQRLYALALGYDNPYRWAHYVDAPFQPLTKKLADSTLALITTVLLLVVLGRVAHRAIQTASEREPSRAPTDRLKTPHTIDIKAEW